MRFFDSSWKADVRRVSLSKAEGTDPVCTLTKTLLTWICLGVFG